MLTRISVGTVTHEGTWCTSNRGIDDGQVAGHQARRPLGDGVRQNRRLSNLRERIGMRSSGSSANDSKMSAASADLDTRAFRNLSREPDLQCAPTCGCGLVDRT